MTRIRRRYLVLHGLRWLPSGLLIPVIVLLMLERGIGLSQIGLIFAIQGFVVLGLELPTGGLADALGRKPVLVAAAAFSLASLATFAFALMFDSILVPLDWVSGGPVPLDVPRPEFAAGDHAFFLFCVVVLAIAGTAVLLVRRGTTGRFLDAVAARIHQLQQPPHSYPTRPTSEERR